MRGMNWEWNQLHVTTRACAIAICFALGSPLHSAAEISRSAGVEIGNGEFEMGTGVLVDAGGAEVALPGSINNWTSKVEDSYTELVAPCDAHSPTRTKLRISVKETDQPDEHELKLLEDLGWRKFSWADMDGLRLERPSPRNKAIRALEVKLFRQARQAIELVLIGNKKSESFSSLYEWLTPKNEETEKKASTTSLEPK